MSLSKLSVTYITGRVLLGARPLSSGRRHAQVCDPDAGQELGTSVLVRTAHGEGIRVNSECPGKRFLPGA